MTAPFFLTIDVDWASDEAIDLTAAIVSAAGVRATWLATHRTPAIERILERPDQFEVGIHPNFLAGSTHGSSVEEVYEHVLDLFPTAISMRSHSVYQSGPQLAYAVSHTPIRVDSSQFLPEQSHLRPFRHLTPTGPLVRLPFVWADDYELLKSNPTWAPERLLNNPGHQVLLFHPTHILSNAIGGGGRQRAPGDAGTCSQPGAASSLERTVTAIAATGGGRLLRSLLPD